MELVYVRNGNAGSLYHSSLACGLWCLSVRLSYTCDIFQLTVTALKRKKLRPKRIQAVMKTISLLYIFL